MKNSTRTAVRLLIAAPLAASAIAVGGGLAHADDNMDFQVRPGVVDPKPTGPTDIANPEPGPVDPTGPGDIKNPEPDEEPERPDDITNPEPDEEPEVPDDITNPEPDEEPEVPDDLTNPEPGDDPGDDNPGDDNQDTPGVDVEGTADVPVPSRIDAGAGASQDERIDLAWVLAGGGLVMAAGSLLARQRIARGAR
ncbi:MULTISPECIES: hypothetical protein [Nocardioides]|uniref:LPXTG cell wall anchor domain-containing protein n=1 Tax=Nocardioides vastitatis TaxID=2568655 RepID=A0ABW0ZN65_9ACTN|nr:hypothetical protein [Nocardioides sp.]THI96057.1 hypothetical protein E7Z54_17740 [Nocardioides sp.]